MFRNRRRIPETESELRSRQPTEWELAGMDWWNAKTDEQRGAMLSDARVQEKTDRWRTPEMSPARCYEVFRTTRSV